MKEIDEAIEEMTWVIRHINSDRHPYYKTALAASRIVNSIGELIREAKKKWYSDLTYQERDLISPDEFTIAFIQDKFTSYLKGG